MKKVLFSMLAVGCLSLVANAQTRNEPIKVEAAKVVDPQTKATTVEPEIVPVNPNAPEIIFDTDVIDYGTVEYEGDGVREFVFTNKGKEPLIISRAKGSCGCTVPTWPKEPIMPGEQGAIKVKYATNRPGRFTKTVTISSNAKTPTTRLTIKGTVKPKPVEEGVETLPVKKATEGATPVEKQP